MEKVYLWFILILNITFVWLIIPHVFMFLVAYLPARVEVVAITFLIFNHDKNYNQTHFETTIQTSPKSNFSKIFENL